MGSLGTNATGVIGQGVAASQIGPKCGLEVYLVYHEQVVIG